MSKIDWTEQEKIFLKSLSGDYCALNQIVERFNQFSVTNDLPKRTESSILNKFYLLKGKNENGVYSKWSSREVNKLKQIIDSNPNKKISQIISQYNQYCAKNGLSPRPEQSVRFKIGFIKNQNNKKDKKIYRNRKWTKEEHEFLMGLIGYYPIDIIHKRFNNYCYRHGLSPRTIHALEVYIYKHGENVKPSLDNFSPGQIAELLNVSTFWIRRWIYQKGLVSHRRNNNWHVIRLSELKKFAEKYPHYFSKAERVNLLWLFEGDEKLTDLCLSQSYKSRKPGRYKAIKCIETGEEYESIIEASRALFISKDAIYDSIKYQRPTSFGKTFQYVFT